MGRQIAIPRPLEAQPVIWLPPNVAAPKPPKRGFYVYERGGTIYKLSSAGVEAELGGGVSGVAVEDEGVEQGTGITRLNFTGAGVAATVLGNEATVDVSGGATGAPVGAKYVTTAAHADLTAEVVIPGVAVADRVPASPDAANDEFDTTDTTDPMTGWTTLGTPTSHDINSTAASHYRVLLNATNSVALTGIYKARSPAFTVTTKLSDAHMGGNYQRAGLFIAEATPGKIESIALNYNGATGGIHYTVDAWTNRTTYSSSPGTHTERWVTAPVYFRIVVTSSTDVTYQFSHGGLVWHTVVAARNPGFTVGAAGLFIDSNSATNRGEALFDWIRFT